MVIDPSINIFGTPTCLSFAMSNLIKHLTNPNESKENVTTLLGKVDINEKLTLKFIYKEKDAAGQEVVNREEECTLLDWVLICKKRRNVFSAGNTALTGPEKECVSKLIGYYGITPLLAKIIEGGLK